MSALTIGNGYFEDIGANGNGYLEDIGAKPARNDAIVVSVVVAVVAVALAILFFVKDNNVLGFVFTGIALAGACRAYKMHQKISYVYKPEVFRPNSRIEVLRPTREDMDREGMETTTDSRLGTCFPPL
jgi:hypothetical protein